MILAYHRPNTLPEALQLLSRSEPPTLPLGGGTSLTRPTPENIEVVDLQALGMNKIHKHGNNLVIGATTSLQELLENVHATPALRKALKLEAPLGIRNTATVAGTLVMADGRSTFTTVLLALDAKLNVEGQRSDSIALGEYLPLRADPPKGFLITGIEIPLNTELVFEAVARTPADKPIVCAVLTRWPSGRTRLALGGFGATPLLAMDGTEADGAVSAAQNAFHEATDEWAGAEYRTQVAGKLASRCLQQLKK